MINFGSISLNKIQNVKLNPAAPKTVLPPLGNDVFVKSTETNTDNNVKKTSNVSFGAGKNVAATQTAENSLLYAKTIKNAYDEKFGEGNWEYVCIGRSCACFADALQRTGVPTHIILISGLSHGIDKGADLANQPGFEDFKNFIYEQGLNPDNVQNSGKTYIFQDYCDTGASLHRFEEFIRSDAMGLNFDNVVFENLTDTFNPGMKNMERGDIMKVLQAYSNLQGQNTPFSFKNFTAVPKMDWHDLSKINEVKNYPDTPMHQEFIEELDALISDASAGN